MIFQIGQQSDGAFVLRFTGPNTRFEIALDRDELAALNATITEHLLMTPPDDRPQGGS